MEKNLCDDCSKEAKVKIKDRYFCSQCGLRILQEEASRPKRWVDGQWKRHDRVLRDA